MDPYDMNLIEEKEKEQAQNVEEFRQLAIATVGREPSEAEIEKAVDLISQWVNLEILKRAFALG